MAVRMKVATYVAGNHDPKVLVGSSVEHGINWEPGTEIVVVDELAEKFERSGLAERIPPVPEAAVMGESENAARPAPRRRTRP